MAPWAVAAGYALLLACWALTNPVGAAPDEPSHYIRGVALAGGELIGQPTSHTEGLLPGWAADVHDFHVPARLWPQGDECRTFTPPRVVGCLSRGAPQRGVDEVVVSSSAPWYPPAAYVLPGAISHAGWTPRAGMWLARLSGALIVSGLLALAMWAAGRGAGSHWSLLGIMIALTPEALFIGASVNPNGVEIAGGVCCTAGVLALRRRDGTVMPALAAAFSGAVALCLSRLSGPLWLAGIAVFAVATLGWPRIREVTTEHRRAVVWACAIITACALSTLVWSRIYPVAPVVRDATPSFGNAVHELSSLLTMAIGRFGWLDVAMPPVGLMIVKVLIAAIVLGALVVGTVRDRLLLVGTCVGVVTLTILVSRYLLQPQGVGRQGRYFLPVWCLVPMYASDIVRSAQWRRRSSSRQALAGSMAIVGAIAMSAVQLVALYANGRHYATQGGIARFYFSIATWAPPLGWWVWVAIALVAAMLVVIPFALGSWEAPGEAVE